MTMAKPAITFQSSAVMLVLLLLTSTLAFSTRGGDDVALPTQGAQSEANLYVPVGPIEHRPASAVIGRSPLLAAFQLCQQCRCCSASDPSNCPMMPCCYGIVCNLPGKPYGECSLTPKVCNCNSCS